MLPCRRSARRRSGSRPGLSSEGDAAAGTAITLRRLRRSAEHRFARDELDPAAHRRVLIALADDLGARLRTSGQIATGVTLTVRYADLSATRHSRTLPEATQHTVLLARTAYAVYDSLGLQRAPGRSIAIRADALRPDNRATRQLTLDADDDKPLAIEAVADRARARYGHQVIYPAALAISSRSSAAHYWDTVSRPGATTLLMSPKRSPHCLNRARPFRRRPWTRCAGDTATARPGSLASSPSAPKPAPDHPTTSTTMPPLMLPTLSTAPTVRAHQPQALSASAA
ncbi:hypothetical protein [Streptomyces sp. NPDC006335]|uniref:DinB/UmuC family translesion DNA polymerase n=1 Tax=Streptomyces sp. NPDC006335 TaxID=3156895 RepID=UPI0033B8B782